MYNARIGVVDYGMGNIHSMIKALRRYSSDVIFSADADELRQCDALVLPGDGAFAAAMQNLRGEKIQLLGEHINEGKHLLGVCIGFQILFADSDEIGPGEKPEIVPGLNLISGHVRKFAFDDPDLRVPHMGWNRLHTCRDILADMDGEHMYFIHSYRAITVPEKNILASCEYGGESFPAAVMKDQILAFQFHPEKSYEKGLALLENWVASIE